MKIFKSSMLMRRIDKLEKATRARSWIGTIEDSAERHQIERDYHRARLALIEYVLEHVMAEEKTL